MVSGLRCPSGASRIDECTHSDFGTTCCNCTHVDDVAIRCYTRPDEGMTVIVSPL